MSTAIIYKLQNLTLKLCSQWVQWVRPTIDQVKTQPTPSDHLFYLFIWLLTQLLQPNKL